jgi:hypothetical protein
MNQTRRVVLLTGSVVVAAAWTAALAVDAAPPAEPALDTFLAATASALERARFLERAEQAQLGQVLSQGVELQRLLTDRAQPAPPDFQHSISDLTELVRKVDSSVAGSESNLQDLALVLRDLQIKRDHLLHSFGGFAFKKSLKVLVSITTYRDGQLVDGYEVAFNPLRLALDRQPRFPVSSTTNNARRQLPPGLYVMTLKRLAVVISRPVEVGEDGSEEQLIRVDL